MRSFVTLLAGVAALLLSPPAALAQPFPTSIVWTAPASGPVRALAFAPDGQTLASAGSDASGAGVVDVWAAASGAPVAHAAAHPSAPGGLGAAHAVAFSGDGATLASGHAGGVVTWSAPGLTPGGGHPLPADTARSVAYGPGVLAVAGADGAVRLLDPATLAETRVLAGHAGGARAVAVSPDGARVASVGADGRLRLWDAATGAELYSVEHPTTEAGGAPISVAFSPNGALVATGNRGYGSTVRVWTTADGALVHTFDIGEDTYGLLTVASLAFSPNGRYLLTGFSQEILYSTGETERRAGLWFWDLIIGDHAALYEDASAPAADGATAVALSAAHDHRFAYALGDRVIVAETPLSLAAPVADEGVFALAPTTLPQGDHYGSVAPADMDGDGDLDLLVVRGDGRFPDTLYPELYRNDGTDGSGQFVFAAVPFPAPSYPAPVEGGMPYGETLSWADADNDGDVDALVATAYGTTLYRNDGGTFADSGIPLPVYEEGISSGTVEPTSSAWGDVDNDGDLDLVLPETSPGGAWPSPDSTFAVLYANDGGTLVPADTLATLFRDSHVVWGDVENDGDLDLLYLSPAASCDTQGLGGECLIVYENTAGVLAPRADDFPDVYGGTADFGDFDLDGDLDILLVATLSQPTGPPYLLDRALVYRNDGATFAPDTLAFPFSFDEYFQTLTGGQWADYDSDGDMDIVVSADVNDFGGPNPDFGGVAFVFANTDGAFTLAAAIPASERRGTMTWADFDGDGDLDFLATGSRPEGGPWVDFARLYRNDTPVPNAPPSAPGGLSATPTGDSGVALAWGPADDDHTPASALTYNLRVSTLTGQDVVSPHARGTGGRLVPEPGNVSHDRMWPLRSLPPGTYTWAVQAVDNAFNGGPFTDGGTFTVGTVGTGAGANDALAVLMLAPNPTAGPADAALTLPRAAHVTVVVFDALGRQVAVLADADLAAGRHAWPLGTARLAPGVYTVQAQVEGGARPLVARLTVIR